MSKRLSISQRLDKTRSLSTQREILHDWVDSAQRDIESEGNATRRAAATGKFFAGLHKVIDRFTDSNIAYCSLCCQMVKPVNNKGDMVCPVHTRFVL